MDYLTIILIFIIIVLLWVIYKSYKHNEADKKEIVLIEKEKDELEEMLQAASAKASASQGGLAEYNKMVQEKREKAKAKILEMFGKSNPPSPEASARQGRLSCSGAAKELHISNASARRYFDDLEAENKVKQVGKTGKNVFYSKI